MAVGCRRTSGLITNVRCALLGVAVLVLAACAHANPFIGTWTDNPHAAHIIMAFHPDGTVMIFSENMAPRQATYAYQLRGDSAVVEMQGSQFAFKINPDGSLPTPLGVLHQTSTQHITIAQ